MRIRQPDKPTPRPPRADAFLAPEQRLDDEIAFDARRDLQPEDVEGMLGRMAEYRNEHDYYTFLAFARAFLTVFPAQKENLGLSDVEWPDLKEFCRAVGRGEDFEDELDVYLNWLKWARTTAELASLFPDRRSELGLNTAARTLVMSTINMARAARDWRDVGEMAVNWLQLFPEHRAELDLGEDVFEGMKGFLEKSRVRRDWYFFARTAARIVLLFPEKRSRLGIDEAVWIGMRQTIRQKRRDKDWLALGSFAESLTILAAQDARITNTGKIEITPKKPKLATQVPQLPVRPR